MVVRGCERRRIPTPGNGLWIVPRCPGFKPSPHASCLAARDRNGSCVAAKLEFAISPVLSFVYSPMETTADVATELAALIGATFSISYAFVLDHYAELAWLTTGAVLWTITEPLRGIGTRLSVEVSRFALK
ncbi:hypothetical protein PR003_g19352 [Phytophthora rubi]|uniref:Uncharacterized protein n=1 Tax=Phytophthora rubi TaxID=129364 RepID=A0A6A4DX12_9STRA|nr:hypothetical protein PR003_g19352 [Phytophthora rubi]